MSQPLAFQLLVVGGGPAGLAAALAASDAGVRSIALVERRREWGRPVQCAEYVPRMLARQIEIPPAAIARRVERMDFFRDGAQIGSLKAPGYILRRDVFEDWLARRAATRGVRFFQPSHALSVEGDRVVARRDGMDVEITADVIIGADGPRSLVRARLFGGSPSFAYGLQCAMESGAAPIEAEVHFAPEYGAGYAWCFPKGAVVNAGLALHGAARRQSLRALLKDFVDRLHAEGKIASTRVLRWTGGVIPVSGPLASAVRGRTLLCGDAAGHAHPLTGAGVFTAITCGQMAGAAAAKALRDEDESALGRYDAEWRSLFGGFLERGLASVRELEAAAPEAYIELVRKAWSL